MPGHSPLFRRARLAALPLSIVLLLSGAAASAQDADGDGFLDANDNCPSVHQLDQLDGDGDGVGDLCDNCVETANGPDAQWGMCDNQQDADGDGYGNACDTDLNNDGTTDATDFGQMLAAVQQLSEDPLFDINCNGGADPADFAEALADFMAVAQVGPSGYDCAGVTPCPLGVIGSPLPSELYEVVSDAPAQVSGKVTRCSFTTPDTSPHQCTQSVLVFPLMADVDEDPPLQETPVTIVQVTQGSDYGEWTVGGLQAGTIYGFYPKSYAGDALPETTAIGSPMHQATLGAPITLPDSSSGFELAGTTAVSTSVSDRGTARIDIPLRLPPGTAGMRPELSLAYDSHGGNGLLGVGWLLEGLSTITRCPTTVGQDGFVDAVDFDGNDRFCWDGRRLVAVGSGPYWDGDGSEYRTEVDQIARIIANGAVGDGPASFTVWTADGRILTFAEQGLREPSAGVGVHTWALSKVEDRYGNYYTVEYHNDAALGELWPLGVDYTGKDGASPSTPYAGVDLIYEARPDLIDGHRGSVRRRLSERLSRIETFTDGQTVTSYWLEYDDALGSRSRLSAVTECGYDEQAQQHCLRPTRFEWEDPEPISATRHEPSVGSPVALAPPTLGDFDGSGKIDVAVRTPGQTEIYSSPGLNLTQAPLASPAFTIPDASLLPPNPSSESTFLRAGDFTGSGRSGLVAWDEPTGNLLLYREITSSTPTLSDSWLAKHAGAELFVRDFTGDGTDDLLFWTAFSGELTIYRVVDGIIDQANPTTALIGFEVSDPEEGLTRLHVGDFNGDDVTDLLLVSSSYESLPDPPYVVGHADGTIHLIQDGLVGPASGTIPDLWNCGLVGVGDFNGDSTSDVACASAVGGSPDWGVGIRLIANGELESIVGNTISFSAFGPRLLPADFNGDGTDDLLVFSPDYDGSQFFPVENGVIGAAATSVSTLYSFTDDSLLEDLTGNGILDLIVHRDLVGDLIVAEVSGIPGDRVGAVRDGLVDDPIGSEVPVGTRGFSYAPLTDPQVYTSSGELGASFFSGDVLYAVDSLSIESPAGARISTYRYGGARWDPLRRESQGFRTWEQTDEPTGRLVRQTLLRDFPYTGLLETGELEISTSQVLERTDNVWATAPIAGSPAPSVYLDQTTTTSWEIGEQDPYQVVDTTVQAVDAWGNVTDQVSTSDDGWSRQTVRTFHNDGSAWLIGLLDSEIESESNLPLGLTDSRTREVTLRDLVTGRPTRIENEPGEAFALTTEYGYDDWGNQTTVTDDPDAAHGPPRTATTQFDSRGQFAEVSVNALQHPITRTYDEHYGAVVSAIDPNGILTTSESDAIGRPARAAREGSAAAVTLYRGCDPGCPPGAAMSVVRASTDGTVVVTYVDPLGREQRSERPGFDGTPVFVDRAYNLAGQLASITAPTYSGDQAPTTAYEYDLAARLETVTAPNQESTTYTFSGRSTTSTRSKGSLSQATTRTLDSRGNLIGVVDALEGSAAYTYGPFNRPDRVTGPDGLETTIQYTYSSKGRVIETDDPNATLSTRYIDAFGRMERVSRNVGTGVEEISFVYDALDRVETRTEPEGVTTWTYDTAPAGIGAIHTIVGPYHVVTNGYDPYGRLEQVDEQILGDSYTRHVSYDSAGRVQNRDYPTGLRTISVYNARGYLASMVDDEGTTLWTADDLYADGTMAQMSFGNGVVTQFDRDPEMRRLEGIRAGLMGGTEVLDLGVEWDDLGRVEYRTDQNRLLPGSQTFREDFLHDDLDRLTSATVSGSAAVTFDYSPGGRIQSKSDVGDYHYAENGAGPDQLTSISGTTTASFLHDDKGNVISGLGRSIVFSSFDKPTFIATSETAITFEYGVDRRRIRQVKATTGEPTISTTYVGSLYEEKETIGTGSVEHHHYVIANGTRVAFIVTDESSNRNTRYLHQDHLGSISAVTDDEGQILARYYYDVLGASVDATGQPLSLGQRDQTSSRGFTDHEQLDDVGLVHANARVLDPRVGQFLSTDPIGVLTRPQTINPYTYVMNNPAKYVDPNGGFAVAFSTIYGLGELQSKIGGVGRKKWHPDPPEGCTDFKNCLKPPDLEGTAGHNSAGFARRVAGGPTRRGTSTGGFWTLVVDGDTSSKGTTSRDAAIEGLNRTSAEDSAKNEYGGWLVKDSEGNVSPTDPKLLGEHGGHLGDPPANAIGDYHNHTTEESFSVGPGSDYSAARDLALQRGSWNSFMRSPSGALHEMSFRTTGVGNFGARTVSPSFRSTPGVFAPYSPGGTP